MALDEFKARFRELVVLREQRDKDKAALKKSEAAYRECEATLFADLEEAGIKGRISFDFGGEIGEVKFQPRQTRYGQVVDLQAAIAALKAEGLDEIIFKESVREGRLNELVRDRLESGSELPEGVGWYPRRNISISRS